MLESIIECTPVFQKVLLEYNGYSTNTYNGYPSNNWQKSPNFGFALKSKKNKTRASSFNAPVCIFASSIGAKNKKTLG